MERELNKRQFVYDFYLIGFHLMASICEDYLHKLTKTLLKKMFWSKSYAITLCYQNNLETKTEKKSHLVCVKGTMVVPASGLAFKKIKVLLARLI